MNSSERHKGHQRSARFLVTAGVLVVYCFVGLTGIRWGLPDEARTLLYDATYEEAVGSGQRRLFVTGPLQTYHVDECSLLMPLARMSLRNFDFNPHWFHWGSLHLYATGAALLAAKSIGAVSLSSERAFYLAHPEEMARIYLIARLLVWSFGLGCVVFFFVLLRRVLHYEGLVLLVALSFVLAPLFGLYSHFATPDVPLLFWVLATAYLAGVGSSRAPNEKMLLGSFALAGLAASTKFYGGLAFLFPVWYTFRRHNAVKFLLIGIACFGAAFLIGTPYALLDWNRFLSDLAWQWHHVEHGHGDAFLGTKPSLLYHWNESLPAGLSPATSIVVGVGVLWGILNAKRKPIVLPLLCFLLLFWIQVSRSPLKFSRYLLPTIPFHLLLVGVMLQDVCRGKRRTVIISALSVILVVSEGALMVAHLKILTHTDVRDRAGAWLARNGDQGQTVLFHGRPYFASPPVSGRKFTIVTPSLTPRSLKSIRPDWVILSDYDLEPVKRAPDERPELASALEHLTQPSDTGEVAPFRRHIFTAPYDPPVWANWGQYFLPHDLRYHCPEIFLFERVS